jgi:ATP-dependent Clp protease adaptor protein ClpS
MTSLSFRAVVESARGGGHVVEVDPDVAETLGAKHRTRVRGTLDDAEYRSNLISMGGRLVLGVHKATLQAAGRDTGDTVRVTMTGGASTRMSIGTAPVHVDRPTSEDVHEPDVPWIVIVWNDPINLMSYVTWVFMRLFGYPREKAERLMWDVHSKGKAVVSSGPREKAESDVARLHAHGLWATLQQDR